jgi:hypothetical protein
MHEVGTRQRIDQPALGSRWQAGGYSLYLLAMMNDSFACDGSGEIVMRDYVIFCSAEPLCMVMGWILSLLILNGGLFSEQRHMCAWYLVSFVWIFAIFKVTEPASELQRRDRR